MKLPRPSLSLVVALPLLGIAACTFEPTPEAPPTNSAPRPPVVTVTRPVKKSLVEWDRFTGRVEAVESVEIRSRVSGYLQSHHFEEGTIVEAGRLLFLIDPRPFQADLNRAEAAVAEAEAGQARAAALQVQAQALRRQAVSGLDLARRRRERAEEAARSNSISGEEVEVRRSEEEQAKAALAASSAAVASAAAEIELAAANRATAAAGRERAALEVSYTKLRAPITGRISRRFVTQGNLIEGGTNGTVLTTLVSLNPIHVQFDATEADFLKYLRLDRAGKRTSSRKARNPVFLALADEAGYPHRGHMDFVENRLDPNTGTIRGRAIFANDELNLIPGLFGTVQIPGSAPYEAILIPDAAIGSDQVRRFVLVVDGAGKVTSRDVTLGPMADGLRVIRSGLTGDELFVLRGLQRVRPGATVAPQFEATVADDAADGLPDTYLPVPPDQQLDGSVRPIEAAKDSR